MKKVFFLLLGAGLTWCLATGEAWGHGGGGHGGHGGYGGCGHGGWGYRGWGYGGWGYGGFGLGLGYGYGVYYPGFYGGYGGYPYAYPGPLVLPPPPVMMPAAVFAQPVPTPGFSTPNIVGSASSYSPMPSTANNAAPPPPVPAPAFKPNAAPASSVVLSSYGQAAADALLQKLSQPDENVREEAAIELGKMKAEFAIDSLINILGNDSSPVARDAAARGLGLIGSLRGMNALIRAAQVDNDRDVRRSAQFAIEVIRSQLRR